MARGKYSRDYRLIEKFQADGRVKTDYEYIGNPWYYCEDSDAVRKGKRKVLVLTLLAAAAFISALFPYTGMMKRLWIALPFIFTAVPLFLTGELAFSMLTWHEPLEHRHADKLNNGYPPRTLIISILSFAALAGEIIYVFTDGIFAAGDVVMLVCTAVIFLCGVFLFRMRNTFCAEERKKKKKKH